MYTFCNNFEYFDPIHSFHITIIKKKKKGSYDQSNEEYPKQAWIALGGDSINFVFSN